MIVYLTEKVNDAFEYACRDLRLTKPKLAEKVIEEYLTREDYSEKAKSNSSNK